MSFISRIFAPNDFQEVVLEVPDTLIRIVFAESGNQPPEGLYYTALTVLHRANWELSKVDSVVSARRQFSGYQSKWYRQSPPRDVLADIENTALQAIYGSRPSTLPYYFLNEKIANKHWVKKLAPYKIRKIGDHTFYEKIP